MQDRWGSSKLLPLAPLRPTNPSGWDASSLEASDVLNMLDEAARTETLELDLSHFSKTERRNLKRLAKTLMREENISENDAYNKIVRVGIDKMLAAEGKAPLAEVGQNKAVRKKLISENVAERAKQLFGKANFDIGEGVTHSTRAISKSQYPGFDDDLLAKYMTDQLAQHVALAKPESHGAFAKTQIKFPNGDFGYILTFFTAGGNQTRFLHEDDLDDPLRRHLGIDP